MATAKIEEHDEVVHARKVGERFQRPITVKVYFNTLIGMYWLELRDDLDSSRWTLPGVHMNREDAIARADRVVLW
jgi:hypothetical protein